MNTDQAAVHITDVSLSFGSVNALTNISMDVGRGELFGLIGPDGAGKTSLLRILVTLVVPDSGSARVDGYDVVSDFRKLRSRLGYMPGRFSLYQDLTVEENLKFFATIFGATVAENYDLIKDIYQQIEPFRKRRAGDLSGGMKQKLALSCALIHRPSVLILDEPTTGVDAVSRQEFWEILDRLKHLGITILVSTPYMDEAVLCDRVGLIQHGKLLRIDTPAAIEESYERPLFSIRHPRQFEVLARLRSEANTHSIFAFGSELHYADNRMNISAPAVHAMLLDFGYADIEVNPIAAGIEDVFMDLMDSRELSR